MIRRVNCSGALFGAGRGLPDPPRVPAWLEFTGDVIVATEREPGGNREDYPREKFGAQRERKRVGLRRETMGGMCSACDRAHLRQPSMILAVFIASYYELD